MDRMKLMELVVARDLPVGGYVRITRPPDPWESSGESEKDLAAYVDHVGLIVEGPSKMDEPDDPMYLVRFPSHKGEAAGQRNIERSAMELVSVPAAPICNTCLEG